LREFGEAAGVGLGRTARCSREFDLQDGTELREPLARALAEPGPNLIEATLADNDDAGAAQRRSGVIQEHWPMRACWHPWPVADTARGARLRDGFLRCADSVAPVRRGSGR